MCQQIIINQLLSYAPYRQQLGHGYGSFGFLSHRCSQQRLGDFKIQAESPLSSHLECLRRCLISVRHDLLCIFGLHRERELCCYQQSDRVHFVAMSMTRPFSKFKKLFFHSDAMSCNSNCHCDYVKYSPVCGENNKTYISACHAGCKISRKENSTKVNRRDHLILISSVLRCS